MPVARITREQLKELIDGGNPPVLVDARLKYPYEHSTMQLPNAVRVPPHDPDPAIASLPRGREVVVYDSDPNELSSARVAARLIAHGFSARALAGGLPDWVAANLPTQDKAGIRMVAPEAGALAKG